MNKRTEARIARRIKRIETLIIQLEATTQRLRGFQRELELTGEIRQSVDVAVEIEFELYAIDAMLKEWGL